VDLASSVAALAPLPLAVNIALFPTRTVKPEAWFTFKIKLAAADTSALAFAVALFTVKADEPLATA
jgi:hypothetical protein